MADSLRRTRGVLLNLKDLLSVVSASGGATLSGFVERLKRSQTYLLIPKGLMADFLNRANEHLLNLKELITAFAGAASAHLKSGSF